MKHNKLTRWAALILAAALTLSLTACGGAGGSSSAGSASASQSAPASAITLTDQAGRQVELDAPVTAYLPDFTMADGRYTDITVRMLLNHSSGLPGSTIANGFLLNDPDTLAADTLLEELSSQTLKADPGAFSVYCNDGFTLAELVVEAVSGL